jgi:anti-anti-sigma regulatory factor
MSSNTVWLDNQSRAEPLLRSALERLDSADDELLLDFSAVHRVDAAALRALEELAAQAQERSVKLVLRGVRVEVYKVLKLFAATAQFSFLD